MLLYLLARVIFKISIEFFFNLEIILLCATSPPNQNEIGMILIRPTQICSQFKDIILYSFLCFLYLIQFLIYNRHLTLMNAIYLRFFSFLLLVLVLSMSFPYFNLFVVIISIHILLLIHILSSPHSLYFFIEQLQLIINSFFLFSQTLVSCPHFGSKQLQFP